MLTDWPRDKTVSFYSPCLCSHTLTMTFGKDRCGLIASQIIQTEKFILYTQFLNLPLYKNKFNFLKKYPYFRNSERNIEQFCALESNVLYFVKDI